MMNKLQQPLHNVDVEDEDDFSRLAPLTTKHRIQRLDRQESISPMFDVNEQVHEAEDISFSPSSQISTSNTAQGNFLKAPTPMTTTTSCQSNHEIEDGAVTRSSPLVDSSFSMSSMESASSSSSSSSSPSTTTNYINNNDSDNIHERKKRGARGVTPHSDIHAPLLGNHGEFCGGNNSQQELFVNSLEGEGSNDTDIEKGMLGSSEHEQYDIVEFGSVEYLCCETDQYTEVTVVRQGPNLPELDLFWYSEVKAVDTNFTAPPQVTGVVKFAAGQTKLSFDVNTVWHDNIFSVECLIDICLEFVHEKDRKKTMLGDVSSTRVAILNFDNFPSGVESFDQRKVIGGFLRHNYRLFRFKVIAGFFLRLVPGFTFIITQVILQYLLKTVSIAASEYENKEHVSVRFEEYIVFLAMAYLLNFLFAYMCSILFEKLNLGSSVSASLRSMCVDTVIQLTNNEIEEFDIGRVVKITDRDVDIAVDTAWMAGFSFAENFVKIFLMFLYLAYIGLEQAEATGASLMRFLGLIPFLLIVFEGMLLKSTFRTAAIKNNAAMTADDAWSSFVAQIALVRQSITNYRKGFSVTDDFETVNKKFNSKSFIAQMYGLNIMWIANLLPAIATALFMVVVGFRVIRGEMTVASFVVFLNIMNSFGPTLSTMFSIVFNINKGYASVLKIAKLLNSDTRRKSLYRAQRRRDTLLHAYEEGSIDNKDKDSDYYSTKSDTVTHEINETTLSLATTSADIATNNNTKDAHNSKTTRIANPNDQDAASPQLSSEKKVNDSQKQSVLSTIWDDDDIVVRNASYAYPSRPQHKVLFNVNFRIQPGQVVAITGAASVGKTCLLHLIARHTKPKGEDSFVYFPDRWRVRYIDNNSPFFGGDPHLLYLAKKRNGEQGLLQALKKSKGTLEYNLKFGCEYSHPNSITFDAEIFDLLKHLGVSETLIGRTSDEFAYGDKAKKYTNIGLNAEKLSQSDRVLVNIACALLSSVDLLLIGNILDVLGPRDGAKVISLLKSFTQQRGLPDILVTETNRIPFQLRKKKTVIFSTRFKSFQKMADNWIHMKQFHP